MYCDYGATANDQQTVNPKDEKMSSLGSQPKSIITFQDLHVRFTSIATW